MAELAATALTGTEEQPPATDAPRSAPSLPSSAAGWFRVEEVMGTVVSLRVRTSGVEAAAIDRFFEHLHDVDRRFSPFRPDSEVSRLIAGALDESACSSDLRLVLGLCEDLRRTSDGYFDIRRHRPDGRPDPTGLVKGWAVEEAAAILEAAGARDYSINAGGDVIAAGEAAPGRPWRVGVRHPRLADRLAAVLAVRDRAVATSAAYERGGHIVDPHTGRASSGLVSLTVVGPSLTWADAYATTGFAMGAAGLAWVARHVGYGGLAIDANDRVTWTSDLDQLLAGHRVAGRAADANGPGGRLRDGRSRIECRFQDSFRPRRHTI